MNKLFEIIAKKATLWMGSTSAFISSCILIFIWLSFGPYCNFSDSWNLLGNSFLTVINFLMVILVQRTLNKDCFALQIKLNELIAADRNCSNKLINVENLTEEEIYMLHELYNDLAKKAKLTPHKHHSITEMEHTQNSEC